MIGERRMATLRELGSDPTAIRSEAEAIALAGRHLAANLHSLPFTLTYIFDERRRRRARLRGTSGIAPGHPAAPEVLRRDDPAPAWPFADLVEGAPKLLRAGGPLPGACPPARGEEPPVNAMLVELPHQGQRAAARLLRRGAQPLRPARRELPRLRRARRRPGRDEHRQRSRLRARARARGVAHRARPREDDLLHERQPRAAHAADAPARPGRGRARATPPSRSRPRSARASR